MKKEELNRLKAALLAGVLCLTMGSCKREDDVKYPKPPW